MALTRLKLQRFTAFEELDLDLSPGINVLVGANGTGKTHLMKVCYAACEVSKTGKVFSSKLVPVFMPSGGVQGRLVKTGSTGSTGKVEVFHGKASILTTFSDRSKSSQADITLGRGEGSSSTWDQLNIDSVYIPVKEMLANAPGFRSLYARRNVHFEEVYADILERAYLPSLREEPCVFGGLLRELEAAMGGKVSVEGEEFFLENRHGILEFSLLAEGLRKLSLLWLLIRNGSLAEGSVLFWDEPETNLNPKLYRLVIKVLLELQRNGVQIFLATHDYAVLEEIALQKEPGDQVAFHALYRDGSGEIACNTAFDYTGIHPNAIAEAFNDIYDRLIARNLGSPSL